MEAMYAVPKQEHGGKSRKAILVVLKVSNNDNDKYKWCLILNWLTLSSHSNDHYNNLRYPINYSSTKETIRTES